MPKKDNTDKESKSNQCDALNFKTMLWWEAVVESPTAKEITCLRKQAGLSQAQASELLGLTGRQLISAYERGQKTPSKQTWTLWLLLSGQHPTLEIRART